MTLRFAASEARLNQAVFTHLSDAMGLLDGVEVTGMFNREYMRAFDGIASTTPAMEVPSSAVVSTTTASMLVVGGNTYRVRSIEPNGKGASVLLLELQ